MPSDQLRGAEKAPWILRAPVRNGAHTCLPWGRRHLLLLVTLTICFYFWRWGRKFVIKKSSDTGWLGKILWIQGRKRGGGLSKSQKPQACWKTSGQWPCVLVETAQTSADNVNAANTGTTLVAQFGKAEMWGSAGSEEEMRESGRTECEQRKCQWCYLRVQGKAGVSSCSLRDGSLLPLGDMVSDPIPSRTWTWAYCLGQTDVALRKSGWKCLCTQNQFAPDIYWLWPVSWGSNFHSGVFEAERNVWQWDCVFLQQAEKSKHQINAYNYQLETIRTNNS